MSRKMRDLYLLIMYLLSVAGSMYIIIASRDGMWTSLVFIICWLFSFTIRNLLLYNMDSGSKYAAITYLLETAILMGLWVINGVPLINLLLCITLADCFIALGLGSGTALLIVILFGNVVSYIILHSVNAKGIMDILINQTPVLILTSLVSNLVGRVLKASVLLEASVKDVEEREVKLKAAYHELSQAYKGLEEMATLRERNRIAREIHDTVGHTLTTVIVEMEAGKMLASRDEAASREKYEMAQAQAVKALNEMRDSVRMLSEEPDHKDLKQKIIGIVDDTSKHTGVVVRCILEIPDGMKTSYDDIILRALNELTANGIRHGRSTAFFLKLQLKCNIMHFLFQDNGIGCENITLGFGLRNMKKGIEAAEGSINFRSEKDEGFETEIELPLRRMGNEQNQSITCG